MFTTKVCFCVYFDYIKTFYDEIAVDYIEIRNNSFPNGLRVWEIIMSHQANVHIQFWQHPTPKTASWTVSEFETYLNNIHSQYWKTGVCGFGKSL